MVDPELGESFQLEAIGGWLLLEEALPEMSEVQTDRIRDCKVRSRAEPSRAEQAARDTASGLLLEVVY
ncbi:hypothetical protein STVIR_4077 [Streptomyces viridochromogenes Tue57]|uniref:Uncharacterized protein n=1 Tax=Streptomyces viridochromogenes Tue57 TaxID=1160705 RepID=L8PBC0_STRVR|nr:hypothetical protein STVIR_4077 [Streptomyces viridochromogenes Tue57]